MVLNKMGFGPSLTRLLMLVMKDQVAQIQMNDCWGAPFAMRCGTRQGNPLSPLIFNLALEPFLCHLDKLKGFSLTYEKIPLHVIKYHAFADDVNVYLHDKDDYKSVSQIIEEYEKVSNSKVSATKSVLLGFHETYAQMTQTILPYPQEFLGKADMKYLGIHLQGVDWPKVLGNLPLNTFSRGYSQVELIEKAKNTVAYMCSKVVYTDLIQCMSNSELASMDAAIKKVFYNVGKDKMLARPHNGGYGVLEMKTQLQGHRALMLYHAAIDARNWYDCYLRLKMLHHMAKVIMKNEGTSVKRIGNLSWLDFLFDCKGRFYRNLNWTFTPSEELYLMAWKKTVSRSRNLGRIQSNMMLSEEQVKQHIEKDIGIGPTLTKFALSFDEVRILNAVNFKSLSRKKQEEFPPTIPETFTRLCPEVNVETRWAKFWKTMYKYEWRARKDFTALHLFNFGSYVPIHNTTPEIPNFQCHICLQRVNLGQILTHLYNECERVKILWRKIGFTKTMNLREMLAPTDRSYENLRNLNWFVKTVKKVYALQKRRAESGQTLQLLSHRLLIGALARTPPMDR